MNSRRVSVIGLGKLGYPMAVSLAAEGCTVIAADKNAQTVATIRNGRSPRPLSEEQGLAEKFAAIGGNLTATENVAAAVMATDISFVVVPTPSGDDGAFINDYVVAACTSIGEGLIAKGGWHLVSITSTVMPGSSERIIGALEAHGAKSGVDFGFCYSPLFIALGNVVEGFLQPDMILIGGDHLPASELAAFYRLVCQNNPPIVITDPLSAELAKLLLNCFLTTKITYANFVGWVAHQVGASAGDITRLIGLDRRVDPRFFSHGPPFGGPCFPRDNLALTAFLDAAGLPACFPTCVNDMNSVGAARLADLADRNAGGQGVIAVLGRSYKMGSPVLEDSPSTMLMELLAANGHEVVASDPMLAGSTAQEAIKGADVIVIMHRDARYATLDFRPGQAIIDPWGILSTAPAGTHLIHIGGGA